MRRLQKDVLFCRSLSRRKCLHKRCARRLAGLFAQDEEFAAIYIACTAHRYCPVAEAGVAHAPQIVLDAPQRHGLHVHANVERKGQLFPAQPGHLRRGLGKRMLICHSAKIRAARPPALSLKADCLLRPANGEFEVPFFLPCAPNVQTGGIWGLVNTTSGAPICWRCDHVHNPGGPGGFPGVAAGFLSIFLLRRQSVYEAALKGLQSNLPREPNDGTTGTATAAIAR